MKNKSSVSVAALILAAALHLAPVTAQAEVVVVVGAKSPVTALTAEQVANIFLGKAKNFPGGAAAVAIDQPEAAAVRGEFYTKVVGKDEAQMKAYWSRLVFTGKGAPPKEYGGSAEVKRAVASDATMIGYIEKAAVDASVKVVLAAP